MSRALSIILTVGLIATAALAIGGCGAGGHRDGETTADLIVEETEQARPEPEQTDADGPEPEETVTPAECPPEAGAGCRAAEGRIVYVEAVDPDGDGDAHFVIADGGSITLPGLTAIDVRRGLRPHPLPGTGDLVSAAGPVQTGSYGQSQIHALVLNVARPAR